MKRQLKRFGLGVVFALFVAHTAFAAADGVIDFSSVGDSSEEMPVITAIDITGNSEVASDYIMAQIKSRVDFPMSQAILTQDVEDIYKLGYFSHVDVRTYPTFRGVGIVFDVTENPRITEIRFEGNTVYKDRVLRSLLFSQPGMIFNTEFLRNDLQRIRERFQADGYVMTRFQDVKMNEDGVVVIEIVEPTIGEIVIQGNKRTKDYVIRRLFPLKKGDLFNSTTLRHSVGRIQNQGFFEDVNVGFEPGDEPDSVNIILTVQERRSSSLIFSLSYGSSSGWGGGVSFQENNLGGRGRQVSIGWDTGTDEDLWASLSDPYMDSKNMSWKVLVYDREYEDTIYRLDNEALFEYDERRKGGNIGFGKKFRNERLSWHVTADWHKSEIDPDYNTEEYPGVIEEIVDQDSLNSKVFSVTAELRRNNVDPYLSYPKGDKQTLAVEKAFEVLGGEWDYTKYWAELTLYVPIKGVENYLNLGGITDTNPMIFAARVRAGGSDGDIPISDMYTLGGSSSLRGYRRGSFRGHEMFLANLELRLPIDENVSIVGFYDIGNAWNKRLGQGFDFGDLIETPGFGIRVKTPIGNIRFDVANGDETEYHFGFGELF